MPQSDLELSFGQMCKYLKLPKPEVEYKFCETRKWRFDFCWPDKKVAVECEGGIYRGGGHTSIKGFEKDIEKYNHAVLDGWKVLRYTTNTMNNFLDDYKKIWK